MILALVKAAILHKFGVIELVVSRQCALCSVCKMTLSNNQYNVVRIASSYLYK